MVARVQSPHRWQPHIKTHKCSDIVAMCLARGISHFKCATLEELQRIAHAAQQKNQQAQVLCSYPFYGSQWQDARAMSRELSKVSVTWLIDNPEHLHHITQAEGATHHPLKLALDVDLGMHRSGTSPNSWKAYLQEHAHRFLSGPHNISTLHAYQGHLSWTERDEAHAGYDRLMELYALSQTLGFAPSILSSGSHSYAHALEHPGLSKLGQKSRVSPGTIVLSDLNSRDALEDLGLHFGALVASRIISVAQDRITLDAGSKALSPDIQNNIAQIIGHPQWRSVFQHEEHLVMRRHEPAQPLKPGDIVWLLPSHVCTTVNLYGYATMLGPNNERSAVSIGSGHPWAQAHLEAAIKEGTPRS